MYGVDSMFKLFNKTKKEEPELITKYLSLSWDPYKDHVCFDTFLMLMDIYDCNVTGMLYRSNPSMYDNRNVITFKVTGTYDNLKIFEDKVSLIRNVMEDFR